MHIQQYKCAAAILYCWYFFCVLCATFASSAQPLRPLRPETWYQNPKAFKTEYRRPCRQSRYQL